MCVLEGAGPVLAHSHEVSVYKNMQWRGQRLKCVVKAVRNKDACH